MRQSFLNFSPPDMGEEEIRAVVEVLRADGAKAGEHTRPFEEAFAAYVRAGAALAVGSGTEALLLGLAALGVGPGDGVITTPMTFCSTINVIEHLQARPVLVDVEPDTLNIDPNTVKQLLSGIQDPASRIKGILPVHLYGHPCEMDRIMDLGRENGLSVLEDAAHALGATYKGQAIGAIGDLTAFSFYATKNITTADGGMLTGGKPDWVEKARSGIRQDQNLTAPGIGMTDQRLYPEGLPPGMGGGLNDIQAALGLEQLKRLPEFLERRQAIAARYRAGLGDLLELELPREKPGVQSAWHLYVIRLRLESLTIDRDRFIEEMRERWIQTSVHFIPVHLHPYYREKYGYRPEDFPVAYQAFQRMVSLPLYTRMTDEDVEDVIEAVHDVVHTFRR